MKVTIIPGEAEEYIPAGDIRTEIESDADYRKRLLATKWRKHHAALSNADAGLAGFEMDAAQLDAIGNEYDMIRVYTHICSPLPKVPA